MRVVRHKVLTSLAAAAFVALTALVWPQGASAQSIVATVNGQAISEFDVANRHRLLILVNGGKAIPRQQAIDELIDERLKMLEARKLRISVPDADVDRAFGSIAQRVKLSPAQLSQVLSRSGTNPKSLRDRIKGDIAWQQVVQAKFQRQVTIRDQDVVDALKKKGQDPDKIKAYEYTIAQAVVFVPKGSAAGDRRKQAEAFRASAKNCDTLKDKAKSFKDAAARDPIRRASTDMPPPLRELFEKLPVGGATPVQQSDNGFEFAILCAKREVPGRDAATQAMRAEIAQKEMEETSKRLLRDLRQTAAIEYKNR